MKNFLLKITITITAIFFFQNNTFAAYCGANGDSTADEWIESISIGSYTNNSGNDGGYGNYTGSTINLTTGNSYNCTLSPAYSDVEYDEYWRIWIDYNGDEDFNDSGELVYDAGGGNAGTLNASFSVPSSVSTGTTRMRIAMKWVGTVSGGGTDETPPEACGTFEYGEVEDYIVNISGGGSSDTYCNANGDSTADEWIESISIGSYTNNSGNDGGYGNYTGSTINLTTGNSYNCTLSPAYSDVEYDEYWRIWIDYNGDEDFNDSGELVYDAGGGNAGTLNASFSVPSSVSTGTTRMRIAMKWVGTVSGGGTDETPPEACGTFEYGEVEDYTVNISSGGSSTNVPNTNFTANVTNGVAPLSVNFSDASSNNPTSWQWVFEGGSPSSSNSQNPSVVYSTPGVYSVSLTASNSAGSNIESKIDYIIVEGTTVTAPTANFSANVTTGEGPLVVNFSDASTNNPTSWQWAFEGGSPNTATGQNPTVVYSTPGIYNVSLTVSNSAGSDTETKVGYINISGSTGDLPVANFVANITTGNAPLLVNFTDVSSNAPTSWSWVFEGGTPTSSTDPNPSVTFDTEGTYTVSLTVSNASGSNTQTKVDYIVVVTQNDAPPVADFVANTTSGNAPITVSFADASTNNPISWIWEFEGGSPASSTISNPVVVYNTPGVYQVSLTVANNFGANTVVKTDYITIGSGSGFAPIATFDASTYQGNAPLTITFFDESVNEPLVWDWELPGAFPSSSNEENPTVTYYNPGTFPVTLTVTNNFGNDTQTESAYITVLQPTSVAEAMLTPYVIIAPNPTNGLLNIKLKNIKGIEKQLLLFNSLGQLVANLNNSDLNDAAQIQYQYDMQDLPKGIYILQLHLNDQHYSYKITKF